MNEQELLQALKEMSKEQQASLIDLLEIQPKKRYTPGVRTILPSEMKFDVLYVQECKLCLTKISHQRKSSVNKNQHFQVPTCEMCASVLQMWDKEALILRLLKCVDPLKDIKDSAKMYKTYRKPEVSSHEMEAGDDLPTIDGVQQAASKQIPDEQDELGEILSSEDFDAGQFGVPEDPDAIKLIGEADKGSGE